MRSRSTIHPFAAIFAIFLFLFAFTFLLLKDETPERDAPGAIGSLATVAHGIGFERNRGQTHKSVQYFVRGTNGHFYLTRSGVVMTKSVPDKRPRVSVGGEANLVDSGIPMAVIGVDFAASRPGSVPTGFSPLPTRIQQVSADVSTSASIYRGVRYPELWPGIDMEFTVDGRLPRYDLVVSPGVDPNAIGFAIRGADGTRLNQKGDLVIGTSAGEMTMGAPVMYQVINGRAVMIEGGYALEKNRVGFKIGKYDKQYPLIIDPVIFSGLHGGGSNVAPEAEITQGPDGHIYFTQSSLSPDLPGPELTNHIAHYDAYVAKFDLSDPITAGDGIPLWLTFLGGTELDYAEDIAVDDSGNLYVVGITWSGDFLEMQAAALSAIFQYGGSTDGFIVRMGPDGLPDSFGFLGGDSLDYANAIAVDDTGLYIAGSSSSAQMFGPSGPPVSPFYARVSGVPVPDTFPDAHESDAYVLKLSHDLTQVRYFSYLGGSSSDFATAIAVHEGAAYVTGGTLSTDFRKQSAVQQCLNRQPETGACLATAWVSDSFVARFKPEGVAQVGNALDFSTYWGGRKEDRAYGIVVDGAGAAYITGYSRTSDANLPGTTNALQPNHNDTGNDQDDPFLTKFGSDGSLLYSTFVGGRAYQVGAGIARGSEGEILLLIEGFAQPTNDFLASHPETDCGFVGGSRDALIAKFLPDPSDATQVTLDWWCRVGGTSWETSFDVLVETEGAVFVTGSTSSTDFYTTPDPTPPGGDGDTFLVKLVEDPPPEPEGVTMSVSKSAASVDPSAPDSLVYFTVGVGNDGPDAATNVTVVDTLPAGFSYSGVIPFPPSLEISCSQMSNVVTCIIPEMAVGEQASLRVYVQTPDASGCPFNTSLVNQVTASADNLIGQAAEATVPVSIACPLEVGIEKLDIGDPVDVGAGFAYVITVTNDSGETVTGVDVADTLPPGFELDPSFPLPPGCEAIPMSSPVVVRCDIGTLLDGQLAQRVIGVIATVPGTFTNTAHVGTTGGFIASAEEDTTVEAVPVTIVVEKYAVPAAVNAGDTFTYVLRLVNEGPGTATNIQLIDTVQNPKIVSFTGVSTGGEGDCLLIANNQVECNLGSLAEDHTTVVEVAAQAGAAGETTNRVFSWAAESGGTTGFAEVVTTVGAATSADLSVAVEPPTAPAPGTANVVVRTRNNTSGTTVSIAALSIVVDGPDIDTLTVLLDGTNNCAVLNNLTPPRINCNIPNLVNSIEGSVASITISSDTTPQSITISAEVDSDQNTDPGPNANSDSLTFDLD